MRKIKFPKYSRKQDLRYKLTKKQIADIQTCYIPYVFTIPMLAKIFRVSTVAIFYWVNESYRKRNRTMAVITNRKRYSTEQNAIYTKRYKERKMKLQPIKFTEYRLNVKKLWRLKNK